MKSILALIFVLSLNQIITNDAQANYCQSSPEQNTTFISGEIAGKHTFIEPINDSWSFKLESSKHGWEIRIRDKNGMDLSQITPPFRGIPNPREIYGWHFRNAANTGKNRGDVNAPQQIRQFYFSPSLTNTGGYRPPKHPSPIQLSNKNTQGEGRLIISEMGLTNLDKGQKAEMIYLKFQLCLNWPKSEQEKQQEADYKSLVYLVSEIELILDCGFNSDIYKLSAWMVPRTQSGDFDGEGTIDEAVQVIRKSDRKRGIAICRGGSWLAIVGMSGKMGKHLTAKYFDHIDWWQAVPNDRVPQGTGESVPPNLLGDALAIGKQDSSSALVYWNGKKFTGYWQGD